MMLHHRKVLEFRPGKGYPEHEVHFSFMDPVKYEIRFLFCWLLENLVPDVWPMPGTCNGPLWCVCTWYSFPPGFILWAYLYFVFLSLDWLWISAAIILYFVYSFFFRFSQFIVHQSHSGELVQTQPAGATSQSFRFIWSGLRPKNLDF